VTVPTAVARLLPGILAIAAIVTLTIAVVLLPWAALPNGASGGLTSNLPWLFGGADFAENTRGRFSNGYLFLALAALMVVPAALLLRGRRLGRGWIMVFGAIAIIFALLTRSRFLDQFAISELPLSAGSGFAGVIIAGALACAAGLAAGWMPRSASTGGPVTIEALAGDKDRLGRERSISGVLAFAAMCSVFIAAAIVFVLVREAWVFASQVEWTRVWDIGWFPRRGFYDLPTLVFSTLVVTGIAMIVAVPLGLGVAIYLSEYASPRLRAVAKPVVEILAGIPTVVLGFFALLWLSPQFVQRFSEANQGNLTAAGLGVGIVIIPLIASVAEDALASVPRALREAAAGLGSRKATTTLQVVLPAASSGIVAAMIIAVSRAFGETMVVFMAGGAADTAVRTFNPLDGSLTMTAAMASLAGGTDSVVGEALTQQSLYFVGLLLFVITLGLNVIANRIVQRTREKY